MQKIIGHNQAIKKLISNLLVQSWLICGKKGIGKATLAKSFASWLLTKNYRSLSKFVCGEKFLEETQLDVFEEVLTTKLLSEIEFRERPYDLTALDLHVVEGDTIGIEKVREMKNFLYLSPIQSEYKIAVIDSLEAMTNNAKNAILKILEEPPKNSKIFIISHKPYDIQTTIKCRCFQLNLFPLTYDETKQVVFSQCQFDNNIFDKIITLFPGAPGMVINAINCNTYELYEYFYMFLYGFNNLNKVINIDINLELASYIIQTLILKKIREDTKSIEILLGKWKKIDELFISAKQFHLDKKHVLANVVNIITTDV